MSEEWIERGATESRAEEPRAGEWTWLHTTTIHELDTISFALRLLKHLDIVPREDTLDELDPTSRGRVNMIPSTEILDDLPPIPPLFVVLLEDSNHLALLERQITILSNRQLSPSRWRSETHLSSYKVK